MHGGDAYLQIGLTLLHSTMARHPRKMALRYLASLDIDGQLELTDNAPSDEDPYRKCPDPSWYTSMQGIVSSSANISCVSH